MATYVQRDPHNLRRNLKLNGNYISNDGGDEGIKISDAGIITIVPSGAPNHEFTYSYYRLLDHVDKDSYFEIASAAVGNGRTFIRTVDDDAGANADLVFQIQGNIEFSPGATNYFKISPTTKTASGTFDATLDLAETLNLGSGAGGSDVHYGIRYRQTQTATAGWDSVYLMHLLGGDDSFSVDKGAQLLVDINDTETLTHENKALHIDMDSTANMLSSSQTITQTGIDLDITRTDTSSHGSLTNNTTGIDIDIVGEADGTVTQTGLDINLSGTGAGDTNKGLSITVADADNNYSIITSGGNVGIGVAAPATPLSVSGAITIKEQASAPTHLEAHGILWVDDSNPTNLYFTDDDDNDIQLTSSGLVHTSSGVAADNIAEGDAAVSIGTSSGDITFKDSSDAEWLTFNTDGATEPSFSSSTVSEILGKSNQKLRIRSVGTQVPLQLASGSSIELSHYTSFDGTSTSTGSIVSLKSPQIFTNNTCDWDASPGLDDTTGTDPAHIQHDATTGGVEEDPSDDALNGQIHIELFVESETAGIPHDFNDKTQVVSVQSATFFQIDNDPTADATDALVTFIFPYGKTILSRYSGTITAEWQVQTTMKAAMQVTDQTAGGIPAQLRGSTSGVKAVFSYRTNSVGQPMFNLAPTSGGSGYTTSFSDATCVPHSGQTSITHADDDGAIKQYMAVYGTGIPVGAYVATRNTDTEFTLSVAATAGNNSDTVELYFYDRVCLQDPGDTSNYAVIEVDDAKDGLISFGTHTTSQMAQGSMSPKIYFDFNENNCQMHTQVGEFRIVNGQTALDTDFLIFGGTRHTEKSGQEYTFTHAGDRMFFGNSNCNTCSMFIDSTTSTKRLWLAASTLANGTAKLASTTDWRNAGGLEIATSANTGHTAFQTRVEDGEPAGNANMEFTADGEMIFTPKAVGGAVQFEKEFTGTTNLTSRFVQIDYDSTEDTASGQTINHTALDIDLNSDGQTAVGTVNNTGIDLDIVGGTSGTQSNLGADIKVIGANANYGMNITVPDVAGDYHLKLMAADNTSDYCMIATSVEGATTISTVDAGTAVGHLTLDIDGDIVLDAAGGDVTILQADLTIPVDKKVIFGDAGEHIVGDGTDLDIVSSNRATITAGSSCKVDSGAGILLDAATSVTLDSATGAFVMKGAGTTSEFSVANSAYAGMILGYTTVGIDATADSHTLVSGTMTVTDSTHNVSFIAPPSGVVEVFISIYADMSRRTVVLGLSDAATYAAIDFPNTDDVTNEHIVAIPSGTPGTEDYQINHTWVVTGLTPGTTYKWWFGAKSQLGSGGVLRWGGTITNEYAPFIMKATALPTAVTDFAVYG